MSESESSSRGIWYILIFVGFILFKLVIRNNDSRNDGNLNLDPDLISAITITPGYSSCKQSSFPASCDSITDVWNTFISEDAKAIEKARLVSFLYRLRLKTIVTNALYLEKEELLNKNFVDQLRIVQQRYTLFENYSKEELNKLDDSEILGESLYLAMRDETLRNKLTKVKFVDSETAYGIYLVLGQEKSVSFTKESEGWKLDIFKEDPMFDADRKKLEERMLANYDSTEEFLINVFEDKKYLSNIKTKAIDHSK